MSFFDKMKDAGEDIKDAFAEGAHDLAEKAGEIKDAAADKALERKIGARGLRAVLEEVMTPVMYDAPSDQSIAKVTVTAQAIRGEGGAEIVRQEGRPARPRLGAAALRAEKGGQAPPRGNAS